MSEVKKLGPWAVVKDCTETPVVVTQRSRDKNETWYPSMHYASVCMAIGDHTDEKTKDVLIIANLIAAAPELYDALENLLECIDYDRFGAEDEMKEAEAALKKARGES